MSLTGATIHGEQAHGAKRALEACPGVDEYEANMVAGQQIYLSGRWRLADVLGRVLTKTKKSQNDRRYRTVATVGFAERAR